MTNEHLALKQKHNHYLLRRRASLIVIACNFN